MMPEMEPIIELFQTQMRMEQEGHILKAVVDVGVNVNKERLFKALSDAKSFYEEGYADGLRTIRPSARWKGEGFGDFSCSLCTEIVSGNDHNFCPNCGAKMDGE
jgi:rubrerythrin